MLYVWEPPGEDSSVHTLRVVFKSRGSARSDPASPGAHLAGDRCLLEGACAKLAWSVHWEAGLASSSAGASLGCPPAPSALAPPSAAAGSPVVAEVGSWVSQRAEATPCPPTQFREKGTLKHPDRQHRGGATAGSCEGLSFAPEESRIQFRRALEEEGMNGQAVASVRSSTWMRPYVGVAWEERQSQPGIGGRVGVGRASKSQGRGKEL